MLQTLFFVVYTLLFIEVRAKSISLSLEISYEDYFNLYLSLKFFIFFLEKKIWITTKLEQKLKIKRRKVGQPISQLILYFLVQVPTLGPHFILFILLFLFIYKFWDNYEF